MIKKLEFKHNYHTHTIYCHHATQTAEENIIAAIKYGYKTIGFSEHAPLLVHRNFRLNLKELDDYINEINFLRKKYAKKIKVLLGLEAEYHESQYKYYAMLRSKVDYMILGNHNMGNPHNAKEWNKRNVNLDQYGEQIIQACKSKLFSCIAHPDYIYRFYHAWDEDAINLANLIIDASLEYDIPLGFNINGVLTKTTSMDYPNDYFWQLVAATKCKVLIEADAHDIKTLSKESVDKTFELIKKFNLQKNIISKLEIK